MKAHALGEKEYEAAVSKSYVDMREVKGGFASARAVLTRPLVLLCFSVDVSIIKGTFWLALGTKGQRKDYKVEELNEATLGLCIVLDMDPRCPLCRPCCWRAGKRCSIAHHLGTLPRLEGEWDVMLLPGTCSRAEASCSLLQASSAFPISVLAFALRFMESASCLPGSLILPQVFLRMLTILSSSSSALLSKLSN